MARRSIKTAVGSIEARVKYDKDFCVRASPFKVYKSKKVYMTNVLQYDALDGAKEIKSVSLEAIGYVRKPYIDVTFETFDLIRALSKKSYILFRHIINNIDINHNHIKLTKEDIAEIINEKHSSNISRYLNELINSELIGKCTEPNSKDIYILNHNELFKGNYNNFINKYDRVYPDAE